ncbi:hypothetical protein [Luteibacter sp. CQ10]|uniref:hypothetical protein n=1 Tax=Luteibacter sp. CQ10 TaxID=2805821 RepID=UPI0034A39C50
MRSPIALPSTYVAWPMLLSCAVTWATYALPPGYGDGVVLLALAAVAVLVADLASRDRVPSGADFRGRRYVGTREGFVGLAFGLAVFVFCLLDVALFPAALLHDPGSYATMTGGHEHIRRIADMCWTLPVIGMLCTRVRVLRHALVIAGLVFPVLVIDRNRIFASLFSMALVMLLRRDERRPVPWKAVLLLGVIGCGAFAVLGMVRSGSVAQVLLPFGPLYKQAPAGVQWLLLYVTAGPYNFASMLAKGYRDPAVLFGQLLPGSGVAMPLPLDASNVNVGTEFLPFLLAGGPVLAMAAFGLLYALMRWSVRRLHGGPPSFFGLLIFLRMAYVCAMAPFAPQAFIWMNFGFIGLCLLMQLAAAWLPDRRLHTLPP